MHLLAQYRQLLAAGDYARTMLFSIGPRILPRSAFAASASNVAAWRRAEGIGLYGNRSGSSSAAERQCQYNLSYPNHS